MITKIGNDIIKQINNYLIKTKIQTPHYKKRPLYHGTDSDTLQKILKEGLRPAGTVPSSFGRDRNYTTESDRHKFGYTFLTPSPEIAYDYAESAAENKNNPNTITDIIKSKLLSLFTKPKEVKPKILRVFTPGKMQLEKDLPITGEDLYPDNYSVQLKTKGKVSPEYIINSGSSLTPETMKLKDYLENTLSGLNTDDWYSTGYIPELYGLLGLDIKTLLHPNKIVENSIMRNKPTYKQAYSNLLYNLRNMNEKINTSIV